MSKELPQRIYELHDKGLSHREIMRKLHVSVATVKFHLRKRKDVRVLEFARQLQSIAVVAPNTVCRVEVNNCVDRILKSRQRRYEVVYPVFLKLIDEGCETISDFNFETDIKTATIYQIVKEMVRENIIRELKPPSGNLRLPYKYQRF